MPVLVGQGQVVPAAVVASGIQYVGGKVFDVPGGTGSNNVGITDLAGGLAAAPVAGDFVMLGWGFNYNTNLNIAVTGYTEVTDQFQAGPVLFFLATGIQLYTGYKFMGGIPDTQLTVGSSGDNKTRKLGVIHVFRGVNATPLDVAAVTAGAANSALCNPPSITPVTAGAVVVSFGIAGHTQFNQTFASSDLGSFLTKGGAATRDSTIGGGFVPWAGGAVNPAQWTFSAADDTDFYNASCSIAIRPA